MKVIPVINLACASVKTAVGSNFLREGWGCVNLQVILGLLLLVYADRERGRMSKSVYVCVFRDLRIIEIRSSLCDRTTALISRWDE